jgi:hypothetical protein
MCVRACVQQHALSILGGQIKSSPTVKSRSKLNLLYAHSCSRRRRKIEGNFFGHSKCVRPYREKWSVVKCKERPLPITKGFRKGGKSLQHRLLETVSHRTLQFIIIIIIIIIIIKSYFICFVYFTVLYSQYYYFYSICLIKILKTTYVTHTVCIYGWFYLRKEWELTSLRGLFSLCAFLGIRAMSRT